MRLSDAGLRCRQTKVLYPDHRLPPWLTEDATRDRSNRLLCVPNSQGDMAKYCIATDINPAGAGSSELSYLDRTIVGRVPSQGTGDQTVTLFVPQPINGTHKLSLVCPIRRRRQR